MGVKLPAFQFYTGDWLKDPNLRRCSLAARGVYIDMLCLMFECEIRGVLATNGVAWSEREIAATISGEPSQLLSCVEELLRKGVVSRDDADGNSTGTPGSIYSRRMVRDEKSRASNRERQRRHYHKALDNGQPNGHLTPTSHVSSSSPSSSKQSPTPLAHSEALLPEMAARAVMDRCRLAGMGLSVVLHRQCKIAYEAGENLEELVERMVKAWDDFCDAKQRLKWFPGAEKFFGEMWSKPSTWPWKEGQAPQPKRRYVEVR